MTIQLFDPVAEVEQVERRAERALDSVKGKRVGYVFNQHVSSLHFWKHLETQVAARLQPSSELKVYKPNTWAQAPKAEMEELLRRTDLALVGVGA
jgi:ABC-type microcin C transport system duplicated ATPase subunit YejF